MVLWLFGNLPKICTYIYELNDKTPGVCLRIMHIGWLVVKVKQDYDFGKCEV
jgi:hypothetical protein